MSLITMVSCGGAQAIVVSLPDDEIDTIEFGDADLDAAPMIELVLEFRTDDRSEASALGSVPDLAISPAGDTYVLDSQANNVRVFDASGTPTLQFGAPGAGPGEFRYPGRITLAADTLLIYDQQGLSRFTTDGSFVDRVAIQFGVTAPGGSAVTFAPPTMTHTQLGLLISYPVNPFSREPIIRDSVAVSVVDRLSGRVGPILRYIVGSDMDRPRGGGSIGAWFIIGRPAFAIADDGWLVAAHADGVDVDFVSLPDGPESRVRFAVAPTQVTEADVREAIRVYQAWRRSIEQGASAANQDVLDRRPYAKYFPVVGRVLTSSDSLVFVERRDLQRARLAASGPTQWYVIDRHRTLVGQVELPARFTPFVVSRKAVTGIALDTLDVPSLVRFRLEHVRTPPRTHP